MRYCAALLLACSLHAEVSYERLLNAAKEPNNWLTYWGDYTAVRHRTLKQINTTNVGKMQLEWMFQTGVAGAFQTVPLVVDGVMYVTAGEGNSFAVDAQSGRQLWSYKYPMPKTKLCCGTANRGMAILGDRVFVVTPDAHLIALDARTGRLVWNTEFGKAEDQYGATLAPLAVKDKILVGVSGGEWGIRGYVDAYYAKTGERAWRFYTTASSPSPPSPNHSAPICPASRPACSRPRPTAGASLTFSATG